MPAIDIRKHPYISNDTLKLYLSCFKAIDTAINLYYTSHTSPPTLNQILISSSNLLRRKIDLDSVLVILAVYPGSYVVEENSKTNDNSDYLIALPFDISKFNGMIPQRIDEFVARLNAWTQSNPASKQLPKGKIADILKKNTQGQQRSPAAGDSRATTVRQRSSSASPSPASSPSKVSKPQPPVPNRLSSGLKNSSEKFKFKAKDELAEQQKNNGLSLLERIKLKEQRLKVLAETDNPETRYLKYLDGKLPSVYDILYQTYISQGASNNRGGPSGNNSFAGDSDASPAPVSAIGTSSGANISLPMSKFVDIVRDSLSYPVSSTEIEDVLKRLVVVLGENKVYILTRAGYTVIRVNGLDRLEDIKVLQKYKTI